MVWNLCSVQCACSRGLLSCAEDRRLAGVNGEVRIHPVYAFFHEQNSSPTEAASPRGRASVSRVPLSPAPLIIAPPSIWNLHNRHGFCTGTPGRKMPQTQREGKSPVPPLVENISKAAGLSRASIRTEHAARYRSLFRCSLLHSVNQNEEHHYCENAGNDPD